MDKWTAVNEHKITRTHIMQSDRHCNWNEQRQIHPCRLPGMFTAAGHFGTLSYLRGFGSARYLAG